MTIVTAQPDRVRSNSRPGDGSWQAAMRLAIRDPQELCQTLRLSRHVQRQAVKAAQDFPLFAPRGYVARMRPGDPHDPLLRQVLPLVDEQIVSPGFQTDPVDDSAAALQPGLLQKYHGRVLMVTTGACAVHCRYCFRRHFPYGQVPRSPAAWQTGIDQIAADTSLREVILSGGDPLTIVDAHLEVLAAQLAAIPHICRLRIHTRLPVVIPQRVTDRLLAWLTQGRLQPIVVLHANHAAELADDVAEAVGRLRRAGVLLLNQSVLLRGVNDSTQALAGLSERLVQLRVVPYYLHQLDRVQGAAHFEVPLARGKQLIESLRSQLPGYAVPRYVAEVPGEPNKKVLA